MQISIRKYFQYTVPLMLSSASARIACHECDLLLSLPALHHGQKARCPRCSYTLTTFHADTEHRLLAFSISGLVFLLFANLFPFMTFRASGQERVISLLQSITTLADEGSTLLAIVVLVSIITIPALVLIGAAYVGASLIRPQLLPASKPVLRWLIHLLPWSMAEIFLVGILISYIKIAALADVTFGLSFFSYVLFNLFLIITIVHIDKRQLWTLLADKSR